MFEDLYQTQTENSLSASPDASLDFFQNFANLGPIERIRISTLDFQRFNSVERDSIDLFGLIRLRKHEPPWNENIVNSLS